MTDRFSWGTFCSPPPFLGPLLRACYLLGPAQAGFMLPLSWACLGEHTSIIPVVLLRLPSWLPPSRARSGAHVISLQAPSDSLYGMTIVLPLFLWNERQVRARGMRFMLPAIPDPLGCTSYHLGMLLANTFRGQFGLALWSSRFPGPFGRACCPSGPA